MFVWKNSMLRTIVALCLTVTLLIAATGVAAAQPSHPGRGNLPDHLADELITYVNSVPSSPPEPALSEVEGLGGTEGGLIAVSLRLPTIPRYPEGAPIIVHTSTFFTPGQGFSGVGATRIGAIEVSYLWPGTTDSRTGVSSEGVYDYGGPDSIAAFRDVLRFVSGQVPDYQGHYIAELLNVTPLTDNVGLYAFSHPGIAATNVMAHYGDDLPNVKYLVGGENPTTDTLSCVEIGHWGEQGEPIYNPYYNYPDDYSPFGLDVDYSTVGWIQNAEYPDGRPYFDVPDGEDYVLGSRVPQMWGKRYYSMALTQALLDNGALTLEAWPEDLATPAETQVAWPYRMTVATYPLLASSAPQLKVMLTFAEDDHVHPALDKPHIHTAYDGFHDGAGLWVRLNPDVSYVQQVKPDYGSSGLCCLAAFPDNDANTQPADWLSVASWAHPMIGGGTRNDVGLAAVAEMADRVRASNWDANLDEVLVEYPPPQPTQRRVYLPLLTKDWFGEPTVITDVTFAVVEGESLALDAYLPAAPGPHPAVILIHGGYWQTGDKESHSRLGEWMAEHGYAAFAINYRLAPEFPFPAAVADVQCAIAWVREHGDEYDVDPDRLALMGTSAGGHLAALAGLAAVPASPAASWQPSCGDPTANVEVQAVISCFGPVDLAFHAQESEPAEGIVTVFLGGQTCQDAPQLCAAASPMSYVTADAPPMFLVHGTDDDAVSCENSARLYEALNGVGADVTYLPVEGAQHGFIVGIRTPEAQAAMEAVGDFLAANL